MSPSILNRFFVKGMRFRSLLRPRRGLAWHCSTARIGPLPHLTPEGHRHVSCLQMDDIASQPKTTHFSIKALTLDSIHSTTFSVLICQIFSGIYSALAIPPICQEEKQPLLSTVKTIFLKLKRTSSSRDLLLSPNSL